MNVQHQDEHNWCWAAVAVSLHEFLTPVTTAAARTWTQGQLATALLRANGMIPNGVDCSLTPDYCDYPAFLQDALNITGNLWSTLPNSYLNFDSLQDWINAKLPVAARIVWWGGGAHFVLIDGYRVMASGEQQVHVQDPLYGVSYQLYDDLVTAYPPGGWWRDTYLVKKGGA